ncbi:GH39 family glycosyl hydrolase [Pseudobutyrivibrio xylanivorans]|uniref:AraC-type DNA-binding protein n=1 Tax=Pseudobutyrivibrio xylanivorans TaxID=185007 RepID=A0A1G5S120_PSEXY|nr:helix-turn-helix domain-containing protein [Pseudobutyrivibrio xylanivorans]SCZ79610.1 AraC-type DNA-binding protein [Pseudobutyrivibrio xylanivorans]
MNSFNQFKVNVYRNISEPQHLHTDVELLYIVEGTINVKIKDTVFTLGRDDVMVINSSIQHSIETVEKSIVCSIMYDYQILVHMLKKPNSFFLCNSSVDKTKSYKEIINSCRDIIYQEVTSFKRTDSLKYSMLYKLLDELIEHHMVDDTNAEISENFDADEKLQIIIHYVHTNYQDGISLSDLAKQMYTSTSTLSRLFKKQTGTYFAEYVNQVRTRYAIDELLYTEKNMTKIAMDCGFSNASAFTKVFRDIYNMAPTEYRQKMKGQVEKNTNNIDEDVKKIIQADYKWNETSVDIEPKVVEEIDVKQSSDLKRSWNKLFNVGFIHDILNANVQYHIQYLAKEIGFKYARIFMVFNTKTMVSDGVTVGDYNFDMIFEALDFLVENRITPWLDFTNRPYANVTNSEETAWFEDISIKYKDRRVWENLYKSFFRSLVRRYGEKEVSRWRFEVGMEGVHAAYTNLTDDRKNFGEAFSRISKELKAVAPDAQLGYCTGAGVTGTVDVSDLEKDIAMLYAQENKPDFLSALFFPYMTKHYMVDSVKKTGFVRSADRDFEGHEFEKLYGIMDKLNIPHEKLVVSEWNITVSNQNYLNDSCFRGCVLIRNIVKHAMEAEIFGMWIATDWQCNSYSARRVINGGGGLVSKETIRKPIFYALKMLNRLGSKVIARGDNYIVTRVADDEYQIICFNTVWYNSSYFIDAENQSTVEDAKAYFDPHDNKKLEIKLKGVSENSGYYVKKRTVNQDNGSIIDEWAKFDNDSKLERSDVKFLRDKCVPDLSRTLIKSKGNVLTLNIDLQAEEFCALHIFPEF